MSRIHQQSTLEAHRRASLIATIKSKNEEVCVERLLFLVPCGRKSLYLLPHHDVLGSRWIADRPYS